MTEEVLESIAQRIARAFQPEKVILFGSYASGMPTPDSDVDILVIMETALRPPERDLIVSDLFRPRPCPMDILVYTPQEVQEQLRKRDPFIAEVLRTGRVLYAQK
ncbi:MAG: hypothetical protein A2Z04_06250 [Chloroflexi bacterium RBG_16_57_9]|nr:MAG: hypothetical protein A2Z04_06250 [Chloroflexi bacterium RBG_16_57_9]